MKKTVTIVLMLSLGLLVFLGIERSIYMPLIMKMKGLETLESVLQRIKPAVMDRLKPNLQDIGLTDLPDELIIVGIKEEKSLRIYTRRNGVLVLIKAYPFTAYSGKLGLKLKEGDRQIPEGIYKIEYLNPNSAYHLSMKINYPNPFDKQKAEEEKRINLGKDIFIHGKSVTIGCIPIGDEGIEELFVLVSNAFQNGIKVILSPIDFTADSTFPSIEKISWEAELYQNISRELNNISKTFDDADDIMDKETL